MAETSTELAQRIDAIRKSSIPIPLHVLNVLGECEDMIKRLQAVIIDIELDRLGLAQDLDRLKGH